VLLTRQSDCGTSFCVHVDTCTQNYTVVEQRPYHGQLHGFINNVQPLTAIYADFHCNCNSILVMELILMELILVLSHFKGVAWKFYRPSTYHSTV